MYKNSNATIIDCTKKKQGYEYQVSTIINGWTLSFTSKNFELGYSWPRTESGNIIIF